MAVSETARLIASLELKDLFTKQVDNATKSLGKLDKGIDGTQGRAYKAGTQIGTGIKRGTIIAIGAIGALTTQIALGVKSLENVEAVTAQTNAALKSTHGVAGQTAQGIRDMANAFENLNATMDDTTIQAGANVLLTFTNIRQKAFKPALQAALDLSTAMKQDLQSSVVQIGKALNDPVKGLTSLTRVGVTFTKQQKDQIAALVKSGDTFKAQGIILAELNREFGGSFLAQGNTTAGKVAKIRDAIDDLQRTLAQALLPALGKIADAASKFLTSPAVVANVKKLGESIAGLFSDDNLAKGAELLQGAFKTAMDFAPVIEASAKATLTLVQAAVSLFKSLPPQLQELAVGAFAINKLTGGLVTNVAGGLFDKITGLLGKSRGSSPANPVFVSTGGLPGLGGPAVGAAEAGGAGLMAKALQLLPAAFFATGLIAAAVPIGQAFANALPDWLKGPGGQGKSESQTRIEAARAAQGSGQLAPTLLDRGGRETGTADIKGAISGTVRTLVNGLVNLIRPSFANMIKALRDSKGNKAIEAAVKEAVHQVIGLKKGSLDATKQTVAGLKAALKNTHDPALQKEIRAALAKVQAKIPGREYAQRQIDKAQKLINDGKVTRSDLKAIQGIEKDLKNRGLPHAAAAIGAKVDAAKSAQVAATNASKQAIVNEVARKELSVLLNVSIPVSLRDLNRKLTIQKGFQLSTRGGTVPS